MKLNRRSFIHTSMMAGAGLMMKPKGLFAGTEATAAAMFGVHPFILENPDAVFIMKTDVDVKTNAEAIREAGLAFSRSVFGLSDDAETGVPLSHNVVMKPNLTCRWTHHEQYSIEKSMGIVTDSNFMEGIIEGMKELEIQASQFYMREVNCPDELADGGYIDMAERTGINLAGIDTPYFGLQPDEILWKDVPNGTFFKKIPYLWPVNSPDSWLLNVSKLKAHGMGLTLCAKNLQGTIAMNYQAHCTKYGEELAVSPSDVHDDTFYNILQNYERHVAEGYPRWDKPGASGGGLWMETWASRCLDNNSVTMAGLHVIEGIYGRDGNFMEGPSPEGLATDYMCNYIIFGRNQFYVDMIGHWLGGHEPGNFGLFHMAKERGMVSTINPADIPVYEWNAETGASISELGDYQRTELKTYYLQKDYNGGTEERWHMVNEPYDYGSSSLGLSPVQAAGFKLQANYPNPVHSITTIPYEIPQAGQVRIEVIDSNGRTVGVPVDAALPPGKHMAIWDGSNVPTGLYLYRMHFNGASQVNKLFVYH